MTRNVGNNLSQTARRGIAKLRKCPELIIRPSDKTNMYIILDRKDYIAAVKNEIVADLQKFRILNLNKRQTKNQDGDMGIIFLEF